MKKKLFSFLTVSAIAVASAFLFSAFVGGEITDQAVAGGDIDAGGATQCYNERCIPCYDGGLSCICEFTGVYGSPYTCTTFYCDNVVAPQSRRCVLKN
ncbi:hypothetical protein FHW36_111131 [Chitinophaga polysaccharea]|uniref:Uncharacterized protein n=1 Tax=Chitinophaga polysaccharea TaxID=1293035 RepID=A0A561P746_9BACT|nr:hypothetical protein [Chitinophaga polysaccharea]TWF33940.1 hypothetical protein FHW36_111131 [Chitinophaga polysaccharea]